MTPAERRAGASLAIVFALRMLGLFLILPVFAVHARAIPGGDDTVLVGLAIGAYGITQAFLQIAFGAASDRYGRKPVILFGLLLFALGSIVAALAADIYTVIAGRIVQGAGAISAAVTALAADLTRERHRTGVMAMIGASIGLVFALSMVAAPLLYACIGMAGIFWLTALLAAGAAALVIWVVPDAPPVRTAPRGADGTMAAVLRNGALMRLNFGVFVLHSIQTMMWVTVPAALVARGGLPLAAHWKVYLPAVLFAFAAMLPAVLAAERAGRFRPVFGGAIALLALVQAGLHAWGNDAWSIGLWLTLFFIAFNTLEAIQPSWISRIVSPGARGMALGVYNTLQSAGLFAGGLAGGWLARRHGEMGVGLCCGALALLWLLIAATMKPPPTKPRTNRFT
ncbi:MAG: MFS transporter [Azoarcus sp.]|jgi:MFS family permease|nr:MFS transporter [Azoarcus sp.]